MDIEMSQDLLVLLDQVSKGSMGLFIELKSDRNIFLNVVFTTERGRLSKSNNEKYSRWIKELKKIDLLRVVTRSTNLLSGGSVFTKPRRTLIINPTVVDCLDQPEAMNIWNQCEKRS